MDVDRECGCEGIAHQKGCRWYGHGGWRPKTPAGIRGKGKRRSIFYRDDNRCQYCGEKIGAKLDPSNARLATVDHVIPVSRGGHRTSDMNMVAACQLCNHLKADRMPWEIDMWPLNGLGGCWAPKQAPPQ